MIPPIESLLWNKLTTSAVISFVGPPRWQNVYTL